jgi:3-methyladenine DNA glycosylase AlkD
MEQTIINNSHTVKQALCEMANPTKALILGRFFKTGVGEYGQGDIFWGITVPQQRFVAKQFNNLALPEIEKLLADKIHEVRLTGALILVDQYQHCRNKEDKKSYLDFYLNNIKAFNNWDLIDLTAPNIIGNYLVNNQNSELLNRLSRSNNIWSKRAAMVANLTLIKNGDCATAIDLARLYLKEKHDLLHKATGWILREVGKREPDTLLAFLNKYAFRMPRVMLRYSLEKLPPTLQQKYLKTDHELN